MTDMNDTITRPDVSKIDNDFDSELMRSTLIKDPIHGSLELDPLLIEIIKTPAFHRLKYIKQLSGLHYVYPGATHTRYEHSIGVAYLAGKYARMLKRRYDEYESRTGDHRLKNMITDTDILCIEIAGLCHDLGHGPFSHLFDKFLEEHHTSHEELSTLILEKEIYTKQLKESFNRREIGDDELDDIKEMIHRSDKFEISCSRRPMFQFEIVANKASGIDVDKWDYFIRDCHYMGLQHEFDYQRLMQMSRIMKFDGQLRLCYFDREIPNIVGMFRTRCNLHEKACQHKRNIPTAHMLKTALEEVLDIKLIVLPADEQCQVEKVISIQEILDGLQEKDLTGYLRLNDGIIHLIENKEISTVKDQNKLEKAKKLLSQLHSNGHFHRISGIGDSIEELEIADIIEEQNKKGIHVQAIIEELDKKGVHMQAEDIIFCKKIKISYGSEVEEKDISTKLYEQLLICKESSKSAEEYKEADIDKLLRPRIFGTIKFWYYSNLDVNKDPIIAEAIHAVHKKVKSAKQPTK